MDSVSKRKRSEIMGLVRGKGNKSTELAVRAIFKRLSLTGWRSHLHSIPGKPDFAFPKIKLAVFVDGCFWHGCPACARNKPRTNAGFWRKKIAANICRDKSVNRQLNRLGWRVLRIWEHSVAKKVSLIENRLSKAVSAKRSFGF